MSCFVLIHPGELALKKGNRDFFEKILRHNIKKALKDLKFSFQASFGRFCIKIDEADILEVSRRLPFVFGIANFSIAYRVEMDFEAIGKLALEKLRERNFETFVVRVNRVQKNFPMKSVEMERELGAYLLRNGIQKKVKLKNPDVTVQVDLINKDAFLSFGKIRGAGGLPVGSTGRIVSLLSAGIDSPVSSYRMMRRGAKVIFVHYHSYPFTDIASQENVRDIVKILNQYQYESKIYFVAFGNFQKTIVAKAPAKLRVILYRRGMVKIAEKIAVREKALALLTGESLGQVASQTIENLLVTNSSVSLPVFRPLIGLDKEEIMDQAKKIGTYVISTQPYGDCCSLFVPPHPEIKADLKTVEEIEKNIEMDNLLEEVMKGIEMERF